MIEKTSFAVSLELIKQASKSIPQIDSKLTINKPSGRFFYDPWELKEEFKNTVWEEIINTLPGPLGEARIIELKHGTCYMSHCDIDDRYHQNIEGQYSFLIDVDSQEMFPTVADGNWYTINTGVRHVAANFGSISRFQLVVRKLLNESKLTNPVKVEIRPIGVNPRFEFDDIVSPWLHKMNNLFLLNDFNILSDGVSFKVEHDSLKDLNMFPTNKFKVIIEK
jgi:hypothetical protein